MGQEKVLHSKSVLTRSYFSLCIDFVGPGGQRQVVFYLMLDYSSLCFTSHCKDTTSPGGERAAAPETGLKLASETTQI